MNDFLKYLLRFILIMAAQLLLFEGLNLGTYLYPMPYILFLLLFPSTCPVWQLMLWGFAFGAGVDTLSAGVMGLHTASFVMLAAIRNSLIKIIAVKGDFEDLSVPGFRSFGFARYTLFVLMSVAVHHLVYFNLESFSFFLFWQTLARLLSSLALNVFLILLFKRTFFEHKR
ncbi:MAG TPA: rod shape-determining protein MreD [Bacteroidales bacterium]|nr:rod shape-determining protein MreD [Bacteroidales bacterium]HRW95415.1 rod shape-determining protein MreD [Bacteroidales bacterium]